MSRVRRTVSQHAAPLRAASTDAERKLWAALRDRRFIGTKFRRQHSIGPYIADFACVAARLVVELDGGQHSEAVAYDEQRSAVMAEQGWRVVRFWNVDVLTNLEGVLRTIEHALSHGGGHPTGEADSDLSSPACGRGDSRASAAGEGVPAEWRWRRQSATQWYR